MESLETTAVLPGSFKKDKHLEKYQSEEGVAGPRASRSDISDAFDDLVIGIREGAETKSKIGGGLRGRFQNLAGIPH